METDESSNEADIDNLSNVESGSEQKVDIMFNKD
jgi:hypothetical protein